MGIIWSTSQIPFNISAISALYMDKYIQLEIAFHGSCLVYVKNPSQILDLGALYMDQYIQMEIAFHGGCLVHVRNYIQNFGHLCTLPGSLHPDGNLAGHIFSHIFAFHPPTFWSHFFIPSSYILAAFLHFTWTYFQLHFFISPGAIFSHIFAFHPDLFSATFFISSGPIFSQISSFHLDLYSATFSHFIQAYFQLLFRLSSAKFSDKFLYF